MNTICVSLNHVVTFNTQSVRELAYRDTIAQSIAMEPRDLRPFWLQMDQCIRQVHLEIVEGGRLQDGVHRDCEKDPVGTCET